MVPHNLIQRGSGEAAWSSFPESSPSALLGGFPIQTHAEKYCNKWPQNEPKQNKDALHFEAFVQKSPPPPTTPKDSCQLPIC
mmetsp:Transcript_43554/g.78329  ORF Transcript_43554/g.78329 Transcript_43554/m.78329 type:complete len:82 (-) Transcript_43554:382-627(-)